MPTGALGYLPLETLQDSTGTYLAKQASVRYAQSLTVLRQLQERSHPKRKRPLLAVGGAFGERNADPLRWASFVYYGRE
jgi:CHAT domain-containing protein